MTVPDDCDALTWNPREATTAAEFRARAKRVHFTDGPLLADIPEEEM